MFKRLMCLLLMMGSVAALARAEQGCPYPLMIKHVDEHFEVVDKNVLWQSQKVERRDFIDRFIGALFTPGKGEERQGGYMDKCIYRTGGGDVVALRPSPPGVPTSMSLTDTLYWRLDKDLFGQPVYLCDEGPPDNCAFKVADKKRKAVKSRINPPEDSYLPTPY